MHPILEALRTEVTATISGLSARATQQAFRDAPASWSIQQIVEHLLLTYEAAATQLQTRIDRGSPTRVPVTLRQLLTQGTMLGLGIYPSGRQATPAVTPSRPATLRAGADLAQRIGAALEELDALLAKGEELFGAAPAVSHPVLGPLSMQQWRRFLQVHGRHHMRQIRAILRG